MSERQPEQAEPDLAGQPEPKPEVTRQERRDAHVREQLREVEAERDRLQQRLDDRDRARVAAMATESLGQFGSTLFHYDLAALRDEDGNLDETLVTEALLPILAALDEGRQQHHGDLGPRRTTSRPAPSWGQMLNRPG